MGWCEPVIEIYDAGDDIVMGESPEGVMVSAAGDSGFSDPTDIASLVAWWDKDTNVYESTDDSDAAEIDDEVQYWVDRHGSYTMSQTTATRKPLLKSNGLLFDVSNDKLISNLSVTRPYTLVVVERPTVAGNYRTLTNVPGANVLISTGRGANGCYLSSGAVANLGYTAGSFYFTTLRVDNSGCEIHVDGTDETDTSRTADWGTLSIGGGTGDEAAHTTVADVLVFNAYLTDDDINNLGDYFSTPGWTPIV